MKVLITGGGGFVGSNLADRLLQQGHEILVIDNYATGRRDNLSPRDGLVIVEDTIADADAVDQAFDEFAPDHVVHAAASYKDPDNWAEDVRTNSEGTVNVVRAAKRMGVGRFVYFQTALCYGTRPLEQPITIGHPVRPDSSYAISKTAGEQYIALSGLDFVSFRLANAYGPRNVSGPLPTFFQRLTDGKPCFVMDTRRDFMYVDDLVDIVLRALDGEGAGHYHVSSGSDFAIKDLFDATVAALGIELEEDVEVRPRNPDDAYTILLDPSHTHEDFPGWRISTPLEEGVARTISYYREHGIDETYTHLKLMTPETAEDRT
jgi:UDP-glucose 4-epimerase